MRRYSTLVALRASCRARIAKAFAKEQLVGMPKVCGDLADTFHLRLLQANKQGLARQLASKHLSHVAPTTGLVQHYLDTEREGPTAKRWKSSFSPLHYLQNPIPRPPKSLLQLPPFVPASKMCSKYDGQLSSIRDLFGNYPLATTALMLTPY